MKRIICCLICFLTLLSAVGCSSDTPPVLSGNYYAVGDYDEMLTPYLCLDVNENTFSLGAGSVVSIELYGSYKITDGKLIATSRDTTLEFEIKDNNTLVLIDNGEKEIFEILHDTEFEYSEDLK